MFFNKKTDTKSDQPNIEVETLPAEFVNGFNPVINFKDREKSILSSGQKLSGADKRALDKSQLSNGGFINLLLNRKLLVGSGIILFIIFSAAAAFYYLRKENVASEQNIAVSGPKTDLQTIIPPQELSQQPIREPEPLPQPTPIPVVDDKPVAVVGKIEFPSILLADSADFDKDDISDIAEELFLTDMGVPDSDNDKYEDGHELFNLYNPIGKVPMRLLDSQLVLEYTNPVYNYKLFYPKNWAVANVDENYRSVLFSTITGENIELRVFDVENAQKIEQWMIENAPTERSEDLVDFETAYEETGKRRSDYLVYYFTRKNRLYVMVYHTTNSNTVNYRVAIKMMARSFRSFVGDGQVLQIPSQIEELNSSATSGDQTEEPEIGVLEN